MARETFTSLKATHDAHRLASDILYQPLHLHETCPGCGRELIPRLAHGNRVECSDCGCHVSVPAHLLAAMLREEADHPHPLSEKELQERAAAIARREETEEFLRQLQRRVRRKRLILLFLIFSMLALANLLLWWLRHKKGLPF